jgi:hypothetical protein
MKKDKSFAHNLKAVMRSKDSQELIRTPAFLQYLKTESRKRNLDPTLFFTENKKFMKHIHRKKH